MTLPFFAHSLQTNPPIQLVVQLHTKVSVAGHNLHLGILDGYWCRRRLDPPPKIHHHLLGLCGVEIKIMVIVTPIHKVPDYTPVLVVLTSSNETNDDCIVRTFRGEASTGVVFDVCRIDGVQEWGQDSPLWCPCTALDCVRDAVLQMYELWSGG